MKLGWLSRRVVVTGKVQGVGFRAWTEREALARGLAGWVRNVDNGAVEALLQGPAAAVEDMLAAFKRGPRLAAVERVEVSETQETLREGASFEVRR